MPSLRTLLRVLPLLCAAGPAAAQARSGETGTCPPPALLAAAAPGRVSREGGRISLVPPAGSREMKVDEMKGPTEPGPVPALVMVNERAGAAVILAFRDEVADVDAPRFQASWQQRIEGGFDQRVEWIARDVVDVGGAHWYRLEFIDNADSTGHHQMLLTKFQGRTLLAEFASEREDPEVRAQLAESMASLLVHDCALAPDALPPGQRTGTLPRAPSENRCGEPSAQANAAPGDPRRAVWASGRISFIPPEGARELTPDEVGQRVRNNPGSTRMFAGDSLLVSLWFTDPPGRVDSPEFQAAMERLAGGRTPERIGWISRGVVESRGTPWVRLEFTYPRRTGPDGYGIVYATTFQGRALVAMFTGMASAREALARSASTLEVRDCPADEPPG